MVHQLILEGRLNWEGLIQELLVEVLLLFVDEDTGDTLLIKLGATCTTNHLEKISQGEVYIAAHFGVEEFCALDDDQSRWEVHSPGKCRGGNKYLDLLLDKEILHNLPVAFTEASMMHANTEVQCVPQVFIGNQLTDVMHFLRVHL